MLTPRVKKIREKLLNTTPTITAERLVLATEAYKKFAGDAIPIFRAKVVNHIMENMTTLIMDDELIVGTATNAYKGANLHPEFQSSSWYISEIDEFSTRSKDPYYISPEDKATILETLKYWEGKSMEDLAQTVLPEHTRELEKDDIICVGLKNGVSGETLCDHEKILTVGIRGYIEECQKNIDNTVPQSMEEQAKVDFWKACIIQAEGLITYAHRMADEAERLASDCTDEKRKKELLTIAENCRVVPENPPQNFHQALQAVWFVHVYFYIEVCTTACGFGRFDQYMWPFYKKDVIDEKNITREEALEMLQCLYLKSCEVYEVRDNWYATSFAGYPMWQILVVGGQTPDGKDATNDLSYLCLEAADELQTTQPVMAVRVWEETPDELIKFGCKMIQEGQANPGFFNDEVGIKIALSKGGTIEEARDWTIVGCIQPGPGGGGTDGSPDAGYVNMGKMVEFVLHNGVDPATGKLMGLETGDPREFKSIEEFKLESGVADSNIHNRTEQATERVEVSRLAPSRSQKNTPNATQPVTAQSEVKSKAPVATQPETKTKAPAAPQPKVKAKAPVATQPESKAKAPAAPQNMSGAKESYSAEDLDLLARLIHAEAQGEPYQAKVAVGAVVLNRIGPFSDSIRNVIYQNIDGYYQFTPVENGWINKPAGADSIKAAKEALSGVDPTNGALFYYDNQTTNEWILAKPVSVRFGNMIFAY